MNIYVTQAQESEKINHNKEKKLHELGELER